MTVPVAPSSASVGTVADESSPTRRPGPSLVTEVVLTGVSLAAVVGFTRLFRNPEAVLPLLVAVLVAHVATAATRRAGLGLVGTVTVLLGALVLQASVVLYPHTSFLGVPTGATLTGVVDDLDRAAMLFGEVVAPAPRSRGFLLASTLAVWVAVSLADWAAFRLRTTAEAVLPAVALFVFTSILGEGGGGVVLASALAAAVGGFALAQRVRRSALDDAWVAGRGRVGSASLARVGAVVVILGAVTAGVVAPRMPGASSEALVDWRGGDAPDSRLTVSPLVDIRSRLVQQSNATVFTVQAERPAYWRLTSLDTFDGQVWSSSESFSRADGRLPGTPPDAATTPLEQTYTIGGLGTIWAPAALTPVQLDRSSTDLRWNGDLATLIVPAAEDAIDAAQYTVTSEVPAFTPGDLDARLPAPLPADLEGATQLPDDLTPVVAEQARAIVGGGRRAPYDSALALQEWFRTNFAYDLDGVGAGHGSDAIEAFLGARRGYCEQFAGTFAAMARSLGLPARVAVGFTPGELDEDGVTYTVRGRNAHAWPEVHIPGAGWVPFEPTPGRGQPGTEAYTGVAPAQVEEDETTATTAPTTVPSTTGPAGSGSIPDGERDLLAGGGTTTPGTGDGGGATGPVRYLLVIVLAGVALLVVDVVVLAAGRALRHRRRHRFTSVAGRVRAAWADAVEAIAGGGVRPSPAETDQEFARRAGPTLGAEGPALVTLAGLVTRTTWAPADAEPDAGVATEADRLARGVADHARSRLSRGQRLRLLIDPRWQLPLGSR